MANNYKLCRNEFVNYTKVVPITEKGIAYQDTLVSFEGDENYSYSIFKNYGDEQDEDWQEYQFFGDDFERAVDEYKKLKGEQND